MKKAFLPESGEGSTELSYLGSTFPSGPIKRTSDFKRKGSLQEGRKKERTAVYGLWHEMFSSKRKNSGLLTFLADKKGGEGGYQRGVPALGSIN